MREGGQRMEYLPHLGAKMIFGIGSGGRKCLSGNVKGGQEGKEELTGGGVKNTSLTMILLKAIISVLTSNMNWKRLEGSAAYRVKHERVSDCIVIFHIPDYQSVK